MLLLSSSSLVRVVHRIDSSSPKPLPSPFHRHVHSNRLPPTPRRSLQRLPPPPAAAPSDADTFTEHSGYIFKLLDSETESLAEYNPAIIASLYRKKPLVLLRRCVQIAATLGRWFALRYIDAFMERSNRMFKVRAAELREILAELGPAYIKIAQAISSRPDLIPPSYLEELSLLQDRIAPFSTSVAFNTIEQDIGLPIDEIFSEISPEPVAAASLGQVYQGRLRRNGDIVAVKVQRPGVQASISLDILILRFLAGLIRKAGKLNTDLQAVVDEWASSLYREMDYIQEAKNGIKFRKLYGDLQDVLVPEMYLDQTTRRVLIMEWVEGKKLSEVKDLYLVEVGVYCSFNQLLEFGFYHADPHPGNLLRTYDGKLAYLDFGMMGEFKEELRNGFIEACLHLINRDFDALSNDFVTLGLLPPTAEKDAVTKALTGVFQSVVDKGIRNISFGDLLGNLGSTMYKYKFRIPSYFSLVIRSLAVLEGIAISFNPDYKVLSSTYPWIARKVLTNSSPELKSSLRDLLYKGGEFRIDRFESLLTESLRARTEASVNKEVEHTDYRVIKDILSFALTEKGEFVREILLQESAKGIDAFGVATLDSFISMASTSLPFGSYLSSTPMTDEDIISLRNFHQLLLLFSGLRKNRGSSMGNNMVGQYNKKTTYLEELSLDVYRSTIIQEFIPIVTIIPEGNNMVGQYNKKTTYLEELSLDVYRSTIIQEFIPIVTIIPELPPESQQMLVRLPADLAGKLISRVIARTIQRIFT